MNSSALNGLCVAYTLHIYSNLHIIQLCYLFNAFFHTQTRYLFVRRQLRAHFVHCWFNFFREFHSDSLARDRNLTDRRQRDLPRGLAARSVSVVAYLPLTVSKWVCIFLSIRTRWAREAFGMNLSFRIRLDFFTNHVSNTNQLHNFE